jgi:transmembrane sensor
MDSARFTFLFYRYVNNTCTESEKAEFYKLTASREYEVQLKSLMNETWNSPTIERELPVGKADSLFQDIVKISDQVIPITRPATHRWISMAAAILVFAIALGGGSYFYLQSDVVEPSLAVQTELPSLHQVIKLPDGSIVKLNSGSTLNYPETFEGHAKREVFLTGEGYFDVKHDPTREFVVHTGKINTVVLGTAFNIKAYDGQENIVVTVTRGKVRVSDEEQVLGIITPNQQITFSRENHASNVAQVHSEETIAWAANDIFFDDTTLEEAASDLEKRFGVSIDLTNDALKTCRFTATFLQGEDLNQMLTVICEFNGAQFVDLGSGVIEISGEGCSRN